MDRLKDLVDLCKHFNKGDQHIKWTEICIQMLKLDETEQLHVASAIEISSKTIEDKTNI